ncbi:hypothetical protein [Campylobacter gastrosuis]|uniref:Lipoprotein n=1 Tax=Campylobacter gastrosuis TaxID=2974576 RepID=A0ABT7HSL4_9BACT|nr:hypothetical protein [Campylobacter gastrosuis]MDL0089875.1 hypothetical protein [Campylobacter gastrosuis]
MKTKLCFTFCFALFLFGCEGVECQTQANQNAVIVLYDGLDKTRISSTKECFFDRYDLKVFGINKSDMKQLMQNIEIISKLKNINLKITIHKNYWDINSTIPPNKVPVTKTITIKN